MSQKRKTPAPGGTGACPNSLNTAEGSPYKLTKSSSTWANLALRSNKTEAIGDVLSRNQIKALMAGRGDQS